jgi:asparagine synthase (glutamine-hydrolysing)
MCAIVGIMGENISEDLKKMLISLKHRGPDYSGIWINNQLIMDDIVSMNLPNGYFGMGHNLLSIVGCHESQPIVNEEMVLVCNGEIYNYPEIKKSFLNSKHQKFITDSDCEIIINLNQHYQNELKEDLIQSNNFKSFCKETAKSSNSNSSNKKVVENHDKKHIFIESLKKTMRMMDGDYAFALWDGQNLALARDPVGVKPLYYGEIKGKISAFASERKALWGLGIEEVHALKPGHILFNDKLIQAESLFESQNINKNSETPNYKVETTYKSIESLQIQLKIALENSIKKRIRGLEKIGLIFSGGVDSTIIASFLKKEEIETTLYTVGTKNSSDFQFAKKAADILDLELKKLEVNEEIVQNSLEPVLEAIEEFNIMKIGVAMPLYLASKMASDDKLKVVLSGQGADELFGGYHRYLMDYSKHGKNTQNILIEDMKNIYHVNLQRDDAATMAHGIELRVPFLDKEVIKTAFEIPLSYKIKSEDDPLRKHILRQVAQDIGVPEFIALRPKKAAQYGSGIHKILIKKVLPYFDHESFMKDLCGF